MSELKGDGFTLDPDGVHYALNKFHDGEKKLHDLIDRLRSLVIVPGYEYWSDPYGDKLLGTIDALVTDLDKTLEGVKKLDVDYRKAVNVLFKGTESAEQLLETPSIDNY